MKYKVYHKKSNTIYPLNGIIQHLEFDVNNNLKEVIVQDHLPFNDDGDMSWRETKLNGFECVLMSFTGKTDKEGNEIYDGDILSEMVEVDGEMKASIEPVFYNPEVAAFCIDTSYTKDRSCFELFNEYDRSNLKVIGNIYEDSSLIVDRLKKDGIK